MSKCQIFLFTSILIVFGIHCKVENYEYDKYLGTWIGNQKGVSEWVVEISRDGKNYTFNGDLDGFLGDYKSGLKCEESKLVLQGVPTTGEVPMTISADGRTMLFGGKEFKLVRRSTTMPYREFINNLSETISKHHFEEFNCNQSGNCECKSKYAFRDIKMTQAELERCKLFYQEQDKKYPSWRDTKLLEVAVAKPYAIFEGDLISAVVPVVYHTFQGITKSNFSYANVTIAITEDEGKTWKYLGLGDFRDKNHIQKLKLELRKFSDAITVGVEVARNQYENEHGPQKWDE